MKTASLTFQKYIKLTGLLCIGIFLLTACGRFEGIPYDPPTSPAAWLTIQPHLDFKLGGQEIFLMQPSTTAFVYLLGLLTTALGLYLLGKQQNQRARLWWGVALVLWGVGALLAGTSYEAFSYAIKCAGRTTCIWTSWWEILYLIATVWSFDAMILGVAYSSASGILRRLLMLYASLNGLAYLGFVLAGAFTSVKYWISFDMLIVVSTPGILISLFVNGWRWFKTRARLELTLLGMWVWLGVTIAAYFLYYVSGLTGILWARGAWFSENDILHIFLIAWMIYIWRVVTPLLKDNPEK